MPAVIARPPLRHPTLAEALILDCPKCGRCVLLWPEGWMWDPGSSAHPEIDATRVRAGWPEAVWAPTPGPHEITCPGRDR